MKNKTITLASFSFSIALGLILTASIKKRNRAKVEKNTELAERWYKAVVNGDLTVAVKTAEELLPTEKIQSDLDPKHISLCALNGLSPQFLTRQFNPFDFQNWYHALFFDRLAHKIVADKDDIIPALFSAVTNKLQPIDPPLETILWPYRIWQLSKGLCDRQAWVLGELSYQYGYSTKIVYLRNPKTLQSPHTICELRKNNEVWVADPFSNILLGNTSVVDLMKDPKLCKKTWPDREDWQQAIMAPFFFTPSYPQDYCKRNQLLFNILQANLLEKCPKFGEAPNDRLQSYKKYLPTIKGNHVSEGLWDYPFRLLAFQVATINKQIVF